MSLASMIDINVDLYDKKYILINAKQLDRGSRFLSVTCYNHGEIFKLNDRDHAAYIRYKKADDYGVFNFCQIEGGKIIVELTEQMLAVAGVCVADLVIVGRDQARVDDAGAIVNLDEATVLSTMPVYIDVTETAVDNSEIESSYEYSAFNQDLANYWKRFEDAIKSSSSWAKTSESWAVGGTSTRTGENTNNAQYWSTQSQKSADASAINENKTSEYAANALLYSNNAQTYMSNAEDYMNTAIEKAAAAASSETEALNSQKASKVSEDKAKESETKAAQSEANALTYMNSTESYKNETYDYSVITQRYAVGGTNTVDGEETDNAKYYYEQSSINADNASTSETNALNSATAASTSESKASLSEANAATSASNASGSEIAARGYATVAQDSMSSASNSATRATESAASAYNYYVQAEAITNGLNGAFSPKGTITFNELLELKNSGAVAAGYLYHISDDFTTDENFRVSGKTCGAGTSVYYTVDEQFDVFVGATVAGVKGENETEYRAGMVNITPKNIGAIPSMDIATVDEVKNYLGI